MHTVKVDLFHVLIRLLAGVLDGCTLCTYTKHSTTVGNQFTVFHFRTSMAQNNVFIQSTKRDLLALFIRNGITTAGKHYAGCIIRAQDAQAFGTVTDCPCEGAKYEKSSLDGITVHCNKGQDIPNLSTDARYDIIFASKLVEPRAAVMVWYQLD